VRETYTELASDHYSVRASVADSELITGSLGVGRGVISYLVYDSAFYILDFASRVIAISEKLMKLQNPSSSCFFIVFLRLYSVGAMRSAWGHARGRKCVIL
jgi:hypothetical protein